MGLSTSLMEELPKGPLLAIGIDLGDTPMVRAIREARPDARVISFSTSEPPSGVERLPKQPLLAFAKLARRRYAAVIVLQEYRNLCLFARLLPARERFVVHDDHLAPLRVANVGLTELARFRSRLADLSEKLREPLPLHAGNDYTFIEERLASLAADWQKLPATVFVPVFNRREVLGKTLAGLALQDYPHELFEVIIADDGSSDHPEALVQEYSSLNLRVVRQEDRGYRLAAVRNLALAAARGDVVVSLDCDMLPPPGFLTAYLRWFHVFDGPLVVIGGRHYVNTDDVTREQVLQSFSVIERLPKVSAPPTGRLTLAPTMDWREPEIRRTHRMKLHPVPYALASGGNVAYWRRDAETIAGYYEGFEQWGGEDEEFAYRMHRRGAYFIPEAGAYAYHQEHPVPTTREDERTTSRNLLASRVPYYRSYAPTRTIEMPKVSVYITAYNAERWLGEAVDSALAQTYQDLEVCICNDGSNDGSLELLARRYHDNPRVRWTTQANQGTPAAARTAIDLCRGEFLVQLDADDRLLPRAVEKLLALIEGDTRISLVYGGYRKIDDEGRLLGVVPPHPYNRARHLTSNIVSPPRMLRSRDYYRTRGFDDSVRYAEDFDLYLKVAEQGLVRYTNDILYEYRWHAHNKSCTARPQVVRDHQKVIEAALIRRGLRGVVHCQDDGAKIKVTLALQSHTTQSLMASLQQRWRMWTPPHPHVLLRRGLRMLWGRLTGR